MASDTDALQTPRSADRRLRLGFFHHWSANWLAFFDQLNLTMVWEPGSGWNQMAHDHVFLEAAQFVYLAQCSRFSEDAGGVLERRGRNKAVRFQRSFRDSEQHGNGFRRFAALLDHLPVFLFEVEFVHLIT